MPNATKPNHMTTGEYLSRRSVYSYPAVGLDGSPENYVDRSFESCRAMEDYHRNLLRFAF
jgi:hypothetical protein